MKKGKIVHVKDLKRMPSIEPPLTNLRGINANTVESPTITVNHTFIPPGARNQRHYHITHDAVGYILKGRLKMVFGPDHEMEEYVGEAGDFFYYPRGVIHGLINLSETETAEIVNCHVVPSVEKVGEGTIFVEPLSK